MSTMRIAVAGTGGLACMIAHCISEETNHPVVLLSRSVCWILKRFDFHCFYRVCAYPRCMPPSSTHTHSHSTNFHPTASFADHLHLADNHTGQANVDRSWLSNPRHRLQRRRRPQVRTSRHRHGHLNRHRTEPDPPHQSRRRIASPTLRTCRVRRPSTTATSKRSSRPITNVSPQLASSLPEQHRVHRFRMRHLLRTIPARRPPWNPHSAEHWLSRRRGLHARLC